MSEYVCQNDICKHAKRYHVIPENHINEEKSNCTHDGCLCGDYIGLK